ncbi:hypothetical protein HK102_007767, partial [Quaeritorhiza haematococci]
KIEALDPTTVRAMLNVVEPSEKAIFDQGALLRQGHASAVGIEGGRMMGLILPSYERIVIPSGPDIIQVEVQVTFMSVIQESVVTLPNGFADGQSKIILLSSIAPGSKVTIQGTLLCPQKVLGDVRLVFERAGQSIQLCWDNTLGAWLIVNAGCRVV